MGPTRDIPFYLANIADGADGNDFTNQLTDVKAILSALLVFPANTSLNLKYRFFISDVAPRNVTGIPGGRELTVLDKLVGIYAGESIAYPVRFQKTDLPDSFSIIFYALNNSGGTLSAAAMVTVASERP